MSPAAPHRVAVIGGGIAGLAAAHALVTADRPVAVTVFEAGPAVGGKIRTTPFAGHAAIDEGADAFLARVPWATALARAVGLGEQLTSPASGHAAVWHDGLHPIPTGLLLGMPTDVTALARSHLLSWRGKARAALEPFLPRTSLDADSVGAYVRARFGTEVHERLVDPLVGSIYAADTDRFSLTAVPQIAELAAGARSVLLAARKRPPAPAGPVFYAPNTGMGTFVDAVAAAVESAGGVIRTGCDVAAIEAIAAGWTVQLQQRATVSDRHVSESHVSENYVFDAVVLACPAAAAARLLSAGGVAADAVAPLTSITTADVAMVSLAVAATDWPRALHGMSGYLVPKPQQRLVTAASFGSQKWAHWDDGRSQVLRISLGRDGLPVLHLADDELLRAAVDEVSGHLGVTLAPQHVRITRWAGAFPQYRPNHHRRVATIEAALPRGLAIAGASYHGIGIPACVRSGQNAAAATLQGLQTLAD